jgi:hypothetical protein
MDTAKDQEFSKMMQYIMLVIYVLISIILLISISKLNDLWGYEIIFERKLNMIIQKNKLFFEKNFLLAISLIFLLIYTMLSHAKAKIKASVKKANTYFLFGFLCFICLLFIPLHLYLFIPIYILYSWSIHTGGVQFNALVKIPEKDFWNEKNEQFPQNETPFPAVLQYQAQYRYKNQVRNAILPILAPTRAILVVGSQGSGKTYSIFLQAIAEAFKQGQSIFLYDYAYPDLSLHAYNCLFHSLNEQTSPYASPPNFYHINFTAIQYSDRSNPFDRMYMNELDECNQLCKILLYNLNKTWVNKEGDFWAISAVNLLTCCVWYLRILENENPDHPEYTDICTLPHAIELITKNPNDLFNLISQYPELSAYSAMFVIGLRNQAGSQIAGQIASAQAALAPLATQNIYYIMSGNTMSLDVNAAANIITIANNPAKSLVISPLIAVYTSIMMKRAFLHRNKAFSVFLDELPSLYLLGLDEYIATIRKHQGSTWLGMQDFEQLTKNYSKEIANVIINTAGTLISGAVNNETAIKLSKIFGENQQDSYSASVRSEVSTNYTTQLKTLLPPSKIMTLSQGEFVGKLADTNEAPLERKLFKAKITVPTMPAPFTELPIKNSVTPDQIKENYLAIQRKVEWLMQAQLG